MDIEKIATDRYRVRAHNQIITLSSQDLLELMAYGQLHASELEQEAKAAIRADMQAKGWPVDDDGWSDRLAMRGY